MKYDWQKIKAEYVESQITLKELSEKYQIKYGYLRQTAAKEDWEKQKNNYRTKIEQETQKKKLIQ